MKKPLTQNTDVGGVGVIADPVKASWNYVCCEEAQPLADATKKNVLETNKELTG